MKLYTSAAIARTLGLNEKEVKALTKTGVIRRGYLQRRGLYRLEETAREIIANYRKPEGERENVDYTAERAKLMRVKRQKEEYELLVRRGQLVPAAEAELALTKALASFKARLSAIPNKVAPQVASMTNRAEIYDMMKKQINEVLTDLADCEKVFERDATWEKK